MTKFNPYYSKFLSQLPQSIKNDIWKRITTHLHNPLTEEQASSIHSDIEALLIREVDLYIKKKERQRRGIENSAIQTPPKLINNVTPIANQDVQKLESSLLCNSATADISILRQELTNKL